jgi:hypothetical protein
MVTVHRIVILRSNEPLGAPQQHPFNKGVQGRHKVQGYMWSSTSVLWSTVNLVFPFRKVSDSATTGAAARIRIHPVKHTSRKTTVQTVKRTEQREKYVGGEEEYGSHRNSNLGVTAGNGFPTYRKPGTLF